MTNQVSSLGVRGVYRVIRDGFLQASQGNLVLISAGVAFYGMLSLFPALAALIALMSMIANPDVVIAQLEDMRIFLPADVFDILESQVSTLINAGSYRLGWASALSLAVALWSARAGVGAMISGLCTVYGGAQRSTAWHQAVALLLTLALIGSGIVALVLLVILPVILTFFPIEFENAVLVESLRWAVALGVLFVGIGLLYRFGPNKGSKGVSVFSVGAIFAVLSWVLLSAGFSSYVTNFASYNQVYGSIGAVIAMLVWLWISSFVVLFGAVLNVQLDRHRRNQPDL